MVDEGAKGFNQLREFEGFVRCAFKYHNGHLLDAKISDISSQERLFSESVEFVKANIGYATLIFMEYIYDMGTMETDNKFKDIFCRIMNSETNEDVYQCITEFKEMSKPYIKIA